jgi:hypothetical protein
MAVRFACLLFRKPPGLGYLQGASHGANAVSDCIYLHAYCPYQMVGPGERPFTFWLHPVPYTDTGTHTYRHIGPGTMIMMLVCQCAYRMYGIPVRILYVRAAILYAPTAGPGPNTEFV